MGTEGGVRLRGNILFKLLEAGFSWWGWRGRKEKAISLVMRSQSVIGIPSTLQRKRVKFKELQLQIFLNGS